MEINSRNLFKNLPAGKSTVNPFQAQVSTSTGIHSANGKGDGAVAMNPAAITVFFDEVRQTLGKDSKDAKLSEDDLQKYERILSNACDAHTETIAFSESASSTSDTHHFKKQLEDLKDRLNFTKALSNLIREGNGAV